MYEEGRGLGGGVGDVGPLRHMKKNHNYVCKDVEEEEEALQGIYSMKGIYGTEKGKIGI